MLVAWCWRSPAPGAEQPRLGDDVAVALGRRLGRYGLRGALAITLLTGAAVAVAGRSCSWAC